MLTCGVPSSIPVQTSASHIQAGSSRMNPAGPRPEGVLIHRAVPPPGHAGAVRRGGARDIRPARTALGKLKDVRLGDTVTVLNFTGPYIIGDNLFFV